MKTSNKIIIAGVLIVMVIMAIAEGRAKSTLVESYIKPSGNMVEKTYDLAKFSKINLRDNVHCTLKKADKQMVKVEMDEAWLAKLKVSVSSDEFLGFDLDGFGETGTIKVTIHYTDLSMLTLKNAKCSGEIIADSMTHITVIAGSELNATLKTDYSNLLLQSGAQVTLEGKCTSLNTRAESGSNLTASKLLVETCSAAVYSGAQSELNVSKSLKATAHSGGYISYLGSPEVKGLEVKSGGEVKKVEE
jgi:hypothetical protein